MQTTLVIALLVGVIAGAKPAAAKNLIKDGGFEAPPTPDGSYVNYDEGSTFGPWSVVGSSGNVDTVSTDFTQNGFTFKARSGKAWMDLTGTSNSATGVSQTVKTVSGTTYTLSFWVGNVYDPTGIFGITSTVDVYDGSTLLVQAVNSKKGKNNNLVWQKFSVNFTATASTTVLSFINGDPANDTANGLDDVSLAPAGEAEHVALAQGLFAR